MKKKRVNELIQKFKREAKEQGISQGRREERARYEETIDPRRFRDGPVWLGSPPNSEYITVPMPRGLSGLVINPEQVEYRELSRSNHRVDFKLKKKGIAFANGMMVLWADWEPQGPYPVVDFADPPRRW